MSMKFAHYVLMISGRVTPEKPKARAHRIPQADKEAIIAAPQEKVMETAISLGMNRQSAYRIRSEAKKRARHGIQ